MTYLILGRGRQAHAYRSALEQVTGAPDAVWQVDVAQGTAALRRGGWDGVLFCGEETAVADLLEQAVDANAAPLICCPVRLRPQHALALRERALAHGVGVTVGFVAPVSPGVAALHLEMSEWSDGAAPVSVQVEQQLPSASTLVEFEQAVLDAAVTLAHVAGDWPLRVSAILATAQDARAAALSATCLGAPGTTGALSVALGPGFPSRRIRVVTAAATFLLEESAVGGWLSVQAEASPMALAAGAEAQEGAAAASEIPVPVLDASRAVVVRFLRRLRHGGADDLATLSRGLALAETLWHSTRQDGEVQAVGYQHEIPASPRLHLLRGGRPDQLPAGAPRSPSSLTVVR